MKTALAIFGALILSFVLFMTGVGVGIDGGYVEVPYIVTETEIVEIPIIINETVETLVPTETKTLFYTADTDLGIMVIGKGEVSYALEFKYDPGGLDGQATLEIIQIEKQVNGYTEDYFFMEDIYNEDELPVVAVEGWWEASQEMQEFMDDATFDELATFYEDARVAYARRKGALV